MREHDLTTRIAAYLDAQPDSRTLYPGHPDVLLAEALAALREQPAVGALTDDQIIAAYNCGWRSVTGDGITLVEAKPHFMAALREIARAQREADAALCRQEARYYRHAQVNARTAGDLRKAAHRVDRATRRSLEGAGGECATLDPP